MSDIAPTVRESAAALKAHQPLSRDVASTALFHLLGGLKTLDDLGRLPEGVREALAAAVAHAVEVAEAEATS